jgi:hypothetical protein
MKEYSHKPNATMHHIKDAIKRLNTGHIASAKSKPEKPVTGASPHLTVSKPNTDAIPQTKKKTKKPRQKPINSNLKSERLDILLAVISIFSSYLSNDWHQREPALSAIRCMPWLGIFPPANKLRIGSRAHCLDNGFIIESWKPLQHLKQLVCAFCALWNSAATL